MAEATTRNGYLKARAIDRDRLANYLFANLYDTLDRLDNNTAKANRSATVIPTSGDDETLGYSVGSEWDLVTNGHIYICADPTANNAVWVLLNPADAVDFSQILPELGDIPWWNGTALSPLHHGDVGDMLESGGNGAAPRFSDFPRTGWAAIGDTLVYSSAASPLYTLTTPGDKTAIYATGCKIRITQGGVAMYFKIMRSYYTTPDTYVILDGGSTQVLANSTITDPHISFARIPVGFPIALELEGWTGLNETVTFGNWDGTILTGTVAASADVTDRLRLSSRVRFWQAGAVKYGIVTLITYGGGSTTITVYCGNGSVLSNSAITGFSFSNDKIPSGFPMDPKSWEFAFSSITNRVVSSPSQYTVYNQGGESYALPPGSWKVRIDYLDWQSVGAYQATSGYMWLDTAANGSGDNLCGTEGATELTYTYGMIWGQDGVVVNFANKTTAYFCMMTRHSGISNLTSWTRYFTLECQYL